MAATALFSAQILALKTARILFSNAGVPTATSDGTAANPAVWGVVCAGPFPAFTPTVVTAVAFNPSGSGMFGVDLTFDQEVTEGAVYNFTATGITGIATSSIATAAANLLNFSTSRNFNLIDMIPRVNLAEDSSGDLVNFIKVWQEPLNILMHDIDRWIDILDSDLAPADFLEVILQDLANPFVFSTELSLIKKRRLAGLLVGIYRLKGTLTGIQEAISLLLGMRSEFVEFNGLGSELDAGNLLGDATHHASPAFFLGAGGPWQLLSKVGTTVASQTDAHQPSPAAGNALMPEQVDQVLQIIKIMAPCYLKPVQTGSGLVRWGCTLTTRNAIQRFSGTVVKLFMKPVAGADHFAFLQANAPDLQEFNSTSVGPVTAGACLTGTSVTPGGVRYWNGVAESTGQPAWDTVGLLGNEVTNALLTGGGGATVLTVTPQSRNLHLSWTAVVNATRYRIYRKTTSMVSPVDADNTEEPIEIFADLLTYDDPQESGTLSHYMVTPVIRNSEGFFSADASGTAL